MKIKILKKHLKKIYIIFISCVIITVVAACIVYASLGFWFKDVNITANRTVRMMPDSTAFHWYISEYNAIDNRTYPVSLIGPMIDTNEMNMKGYGKYHMQMQYNLCNFINYCHSDSTYASVIEPLCIFGDQTREFPDSLNYNSLITNLSGQASYSANVRTILNNIWNTLSTTYGPAFETLQDEFITRKYLLPAINRMRLSDTEYRNIFHQDGSFVLSLNDIDNLDGDEFMTALLSSVYSDFYTADMSNIAANQIDIGRANLVPFLYNVDVTGTSGRDIAKYAYIAYIEGFIVAGRTDGFHYWEQEYEAVFGESYDLSEDEIETLRIKFENAMTVLNVDGEQGNKGNRLLGSTITDVIRSPYNVETQLAQTKNIINDILDGIDIDTDYKDLIAKNYLMVKHMMDNSHIDNTIKDYCQGVVFNESKFSQGQFEEKNTNTALLADFQLVECNKEWYNFITDTDEDGLSDKSELGSQIKQDITKFVEKKLSTGEDLYTKAVNWRKFNDFIEVEGTDSSNCKVYAKTYKYSSNPVLKDTDFDGIEDGKKNLIGGSSVDQEPKNNNFKGSRMTTNEGNLDVDFNNDFRYFLWDEDKYNDELAQMSLIMSNLANGKTITLKQENKNYGTLDIIEYMDRLGFNNIDNIEVYNENNVIVNCYIGYKSMDYYGKKRGVIGIFVNTNESVEAYRDLVVNRDNLYIEGLARIQVGNNVDRTNGIYTIIADEIYKSIDIQKLMSLEDKYELDYCYWISGKGIAGGLASEVGRLLKGSTYKLIISDFIKDVYCYTFGSPKTHIEYPNANNFIKNIINEDDYLTKVIQDNSGVRAGKVYNASIYNELIYNYKYITKNNPKYTGNYMKIHSMINAINTIMNSHPEENEDLNMDISELLSKYISNTSTNTDMSRLNANNETRTLSTQITNQIRNNELKTASSVKAYWTLAKMLEGLDEKTNNRRSYDKTIETASSEIWDYIAFPCYQKKVGIPINNEVPMYFQTNERWSRFRYGRREDYTDNENDDNRVMREDSNYSYATLYEAGCGPSSVAMVLSYLYKKYITPMDVRNRMEDNEVFYRNDANGGSGTIHNVLSDDIPDIFNVNCVNIGRTNNNVKRVLKALIDGKPVIAVCHGENSSEYPNNKSYFTKTGHYIVLAGVNKDDIANVTADDIDDFDTTRLNQIRIYVCDPAYYHHSWTRTCTHPYTYNDFISAKGAGADIFWIYTKEVNATYDDDLWDYRNNHYTETFDPQKYKEYLPTTREINNPYREYNWEEPSWEYLD